MKKCLIYMSALFLFVNTVYADMISEADVNAFVESSGKETVSGNILIWFLCAVSFLKICQKWDSILSSLGLNVAPSTGGMFRDMMVAMKGVNMIKSAAESGSFDGKVSASGTDMQPSFLEGGLSGAIGRKFTDSVVGGATNPEGTAISSALFEKSLDKGGKLANQVISKVATGDIGKTGSITGENAGNALAAYLGMDKGAVATAEAPEGSVGKSGQLGESVDGIDETAGSLMEGPTIESGLGQDFEDMDASVAGGENLPEDMIPAFSPEMSGEYDKDEQLLQDAAMTDFASETAIGISPENHTANTLNADETMVQSMDQSVDASGSVDASDMDFNSEENITTDALVGSGADNGITIPDAATVPALAAERDISREIKSIGADSFGSMAATASEGITPDAQPPIPTSFKDVEIGGGRITGKEVNPENPEGIGFSMYNTDKYMEPKGEYSMVETIDGAKWYKQYAMDAVKKTPVSIDDKNNVVYDNEIVKEMPPVPQRKDKV